jgi:hypothetical protein
LRYAPSGRDWALFADGIIGRCCASTRRRFDPMRRLPVAAAAIVAALALTAPTVLAAITFHSGPTVTFNGATVTATANVSGLGTVPAFAQLTVNGFALYVCSNKGGNEAPGQNPIPATGASPVQDLGNTDHNGRASVDVSATLTAPLTIDAKEAGCPNGNWMATLDSLTVTSATLTITQGGATIFQQTFTP